MVKPPIKRNLKRIESTYFIPTNIRNTAVLVPRPLEIGLMMGLLNWSIESDGWKRMKEIIDLKPLIANISNQQNKNYNPFWKSPGTNFPKYIKELEKEGLVEKKEITIYLKYRMAKHFVWKIKQNYELFDMLHSWCVLYDTANRQGIYDFNRPYYDFYKRSTYFETVYPKVKDKISIDVVRAIKKEEKIVIYDYKKTLYSALSMEPLLFGADERKEKRDYFINEFLSKTIKNHNQPKVPKTDKTISKQQNYI